MRKPFPGLCWVRIGAPGVEECAQQVVAVGFERIAGNLAVNPTQRVETLLPLGSVRFVFHRLYDVAERYLGGIHGVERIVERCSGELPVAYVPCRFEPDVGGFEQDRGPDAAVVVHQVGDRRFGDVSADAECAVAAYDRNGQHRVVLVGRAQAKRVARGEAGFARKGVVGASAAG